MLEQRNDTFKNTTAHSQAKVLQLEQFKVAMTTELSQSAAQQSALQLELAASRQAEADLKQKLAAATAESMKNSDDYVTLREKHEGGSAPLPRPLLHPLSALSSLQRCRWRRRRWGRGFARSGPAPSSCAESCRPWRRSWQRSKVTGRSRRRWVWLVSGVAVLLP